MDDADPLATTAPEGLAFSMRGFDDGERAERLAHLIGAVVRELGRHMDLSRLDGVTVAFDYDEALAELDRGIATTRPLLRTSDEHLSGVAMAPAVLRDGLVKAHVVLWAPAVLPLEADRSDAFDAALYLVAHECGHVADLKMRDENFPGTILQKTLLGVEEAILGPIAEALWEEYAASRASAPFGRGQTAYYEEGFVLVLGSARERADAAIGAYRLHEDVGRVLAEAGGPLAEPLRLGAYLFGHLDGLGEGLDSAPGARDLLASSPYRLFVQRTTDALRDLWERRGRWTSLADLDPLRQVGREVLADGGLVLSRTPDGRCHVGVPFTPRTLP